MVSKSHKILSIAAYHIAVHSRKLGPSKGTSRIDRVRKDTQAISELLQEVDDTTQEVQ